jgi:RNA polymerase sigma-70 factor, ECF subfamily
MSAADDVYDNLIAPIEDRMMRTVARIVRDPDDAADAFQNALMAVWKDLRKIHEHPNPHAYILRVCVSAAYDSVRRRSRLEKRQTVLESNVAALDGPESSLLARERERAVLDAIASLPKQQAEAVLMRIVAEESFEAIAQALGCGETTARSHVSKGKARLRKILFDLNPACVKESGI